jgi:uncharacterized protein (DUF58 family)
MELPAEILKKVKLLEIGTRKIVNNSFAGEYHTLFKGQGMTFAEFREYVPGDDVRAISWPLTARTGKPYIKKFDEEREMSLLLAVDISGSVDFGSNNQFKGEVMIQLAALMAFAAVRNKDQVGLLLFSDQIEHFVPPRKGSGHVHRILRDLFYFKPKSRKTKISVAADYLLGILKKRSLVFFLSDFMDKDFSNSLRMLSRKHELVAAVVTDPAEYKLPQLGLVELQDAETGDVLLIDTSDKNFQKWFADSNARVKLERAKSFRQSGVDFVEIERPEIAVDVLIRFFRRRKLLGRGA